MRNYTKNSNDTLTIDAEPIKSGMLIQRQVEPKTKYVAQIEVDTEEIVKRIKEEYDITDGWVPCSERLPNERGWYLITVQDVNRFTDVDYYYGNSDWDEVSSKQEVLAWMSLPEPYKGGDRE